MLSPKTGREDSVTDNDFEIPRTIHPVNLIVHHAQKSEIEEAMVKQEHGMKDALELFYACNFIPSQQNPPESYTAPTSEAPVFSQGRIILKP